MVSVLEDIQCVQNTTGKTAMVWCIGDDITRSNRLSASRPSPSTYGCVDVRFRRIGIGQLFRCLVVGHFYFRHVFFILPTLHDIGSNRESGFTSEKTVVFIVFCWKSLKFSSAARSRNPENPPILDNLEGKPLGLFEESSWLRDFIFCRLFLAIVLMSLKSYIRYARMINYMPQ